MIDLIHLPSTIHAYIGGSDGPLSIDESFSSYMGVTWGRLGNGIIYSTHEFLTSYTLTKLTYKFYVYSTADTPEDYGMDLSAYHRIEAYYGGSWHVIAGTSYYFQSEHWGSAGNRTFQNLVEDTTYVSIPACSKVRAISGGGGSVSGGDGKNSGFARIYEIQAFGIASVKNVQII